MSIQLSNLSNLSKLPIEIFLHEIVPFMCGYEHTCICKFKKKHKYNYNCEAHKNIIKTLNRINIMPLIYCASEHNSSPQEIINYIINRMCYNKKIKENNFLIFKNFQNIVHNNKLLTKNMQMLHGIYSCMYDNIQKNSNSNKNKKIYYKEIVSNELVTSYNNLKSKIPKSLLGDMETYIEKNNIDNRLQNLLDICGTQINTKLVEVCANIALIEKYVQYTLYNNSLVYPNLTFRIFDLYINYIFDEVPHNIITQSHCLSWLYNHDINLKISNISNIYLSESKKCNSKKYNSNCNQYGVTLYNYDDYTFYYKLITCSKNNKRKLITCEYFGISLIFMSYIKNFMDIDKSIHLFLFYKIIWSLPHGDYFMKYLNALYNVLLLCYQMHFKKKNYTLFKNKIIDFICDTVNVPHGHYITYNKSQNIFK